MIKPKKLIQAFHYTVWLALLTLFLVLTVYPDFRFGIKDFRLGMVYAQSQLLSQGTTLYDAGRFSDAVGVWQQAYQEFETTSDRQNQALTLTYLSNAYQELGQWEQASQTITKSLKLIESGLNTANQKLIFAQALNTQGSLQLALGQSEAALNTWQLAETAYTQAGDRTGSLGSKINQATALQALGLYRRAETTLEQLNQKLLSAPDSLLKATSLRSLGIALQVVGDAERSQQVLEQSLAIATRLNSRSDISAASFSLGNTALSLSNLKLAIELYQKAAENATSAIAKIEALLNQLSLLVQTKQQTEALALLPAIKSELANLSPSRDAVYAQVNYAQTLIKIGTIKEGEGETRRLGALEQGILGDIEFFNSKLSNDQLPITNSQNIAKILANAVQQARILKDPRAESYALIKLGYLYQLSQQLVEAQNLTQQALLLAQKISADDITARTQAQLGDIFKQQKEIDKAIAAYTEAVKTFQSLRSDLVAVNPNVQFSFRDSIEPVYRELVGLLLQFNPNQENIQQARKVLEALQLAELENFFREACLRVKPQQIEQIDPTAAVIYPIILADRIEVILSLPRQPLRRYTTQLPQTDVEKTIDGLLEALNPFFSSRSRLQLSQTVYNWLIKPAEADLAANQIKTLVFVLDGSLRNLPMAALYDGKNYLVEKYNVALTPSLQLFEPRSLAVGQLKALTAGLTEARQGFSALPGVKLEVEQIASELPARIVLDREFTAQNLQKQIQATSFPIVHLATHGQFSSNPEQTFILTWDGKIKVKELEDILRFREQDSPNPIELLVLSACQTAAGDRRAALGLAGVAVRSGARSTLATLWSVKDQSTAQVMSDFYLNLSQGIGKAEALRKAQLSLQAQAKYQHPFYWASFVLVGNWL